MAPPTFEVSALRAYPINATAVLLRWTNPTAPGISSFNITYVNTTGSFGYQHLNNTNAMQRRSGARAVNHTVAGLYPNGVYEFNVTALFLLDVVAGPVVRLTADDAGRPRTSVRLGINFDGDEYADADAREEDADGDGIVDGDDSCPRGRIRWDAVATRGGNQTLQDYDGDGCRNDEDDDTDSDGKLNLADLCDYSPIVRFTNGTIDLSAFVDVDNDGCHDSTGGAAGAAEDPHLGDSDNDGVGNATDPAPLDAGFSAYQATNVSAAQTGERQFNILWRLNLIAGDVIAGEAIHYRRSGIFVGTVSPTTSLYNIPRAGEVLSSISIADSIADDTNYSFAVLVTVRRGAGNLSSVLSDYSANLTVIGDSNRNSDGDTIPDIRDNCDFVDNEDQANHDRDDLGDECDPDDDNDGTNDMADAFPFDASESADSDGDGTGDNADVDEDGNGLIEIRTPAELDAMRNNLLGTGLDFSPDGANTNDLVVTTICDTISDSDPNVQTTRRQECLIKLSGGDSTGCGGMSGITACNGYELVRDIDLSGSDWQPIGACAGTDDTPCDGDVREGDKFAAIFDGRGYSISNITISPSAGTAGVGLFGAATFFTAPLESEHRDSSAEFRNLRLTDVRIGTAEAPAANNAGALLGYGNSQGDRRVVISDVVLAGPGNAIHGLSNVGGLVGDGDSAMISSSSARATSISGLSNIGGLVGLATRAGISSSSALVDAISGFSYVGGLLGDGRNARISSSFAAVDSISYQAFSGYSQPSGFGGLVGIGSSAMINSSYALTTDIISSLSIYSNLDGLVGNSGQASNDNLASVTDSYWGDGVRYTRSGTTSTMRPDTGNDNLADPSHRTEAQGGAAHSHEELRSPTSFDSGIYATWNDNYFCADGTTAAWNLGTAQQFPALNCFGALGLTPAEQDQLIDAVLGGRMPVGVLLPLLD